MSQLLIVDDEPVIIEMCRALFKDTADIQTCTTVEEAKKHLPHTRFLLTDYLFPESTVFPESTGLELVKEAIRLRIPYFMITGSRDQLLAQAPDMDPHYLEKPVHLLALSAIVRTRMQQEGFDTFYTAKLPLTFSHDYANKHNALDVKIALEQAKLSLVVQDDTDSWMTHARALSEISLLVFTMPNVQNAQTGAWLAEEINTPYLISSDKPVPGYEKCHISYPINSDELVARASELL